MFQSDIITFLRAWLTAPLRVAAVAPSSPALARLMTKELTSGSGPVIELGPGTGAFTRALIACGLQQRDRNRAVADDRRRDVLDDIGKAWDLGRLNVHSVRQNGCCARRESAEADGPGQTEDQRR